MLVQRGNSGVAGGIPVSGRNSGVRGGIPVSEHLFAWRTTTRARLTDDAEAMGNDLDPVLCTVGPATAQRQPHAIQLLGRLFPTDLPSPAGPTFRLSATELLPFRERVQDGIGMPGAMAAVARPGILARIGHHRGPHRVGLDVPQNDEQVVAVLEPLGVRAARGQTDLEVFPQKLLNRSDPEATRVTLMTDLSDPTRPQILAVERGRDTTATLKCLDRLTQEQRQQVRTHRVDMGPAYPAACALRLPHSRAVTDRFHVAKKFNEVVDSLRKNITREYKAKLTKDQRKAFRSQMWAFRRDPESLSAEEKPALEALFEKIPALRPLYKVRLRFKEIFDTVRDRITAARWLRELRRECGQLGLDLGSFFETYDRWKTKILNYFDARQTSAAVEGINNKARVITKRTYGLKSAKSLWDRLILDLNRASQAIGYSIEHIRQMAKGLKALFDWSCT